MTGMILKYRCPRRPGEVEAEPPLGPLKDAQRAVSLVRSKAAEWEIDPQRIGMIGFSAGGHLVGATATNFDRRSSTSRSTTSIGSAAGPTSRIMAYSGYLYQIDKQQLSPTVPIVPDVPPLFLVHASDDPVRGSEAENSIRFSLALKQAGVPSELHIYSSGGHGFGVRQDGGPCSGWTRSCAEWLDRSGVLRPKPL